MSECDRQAVDGTAVLYDQCGRNTRNYVFSLRAEFCRISYRRASPLALPVSLKIEK